MRVSCHHLLWRYVSFYFPSINNKTKRINSPIEEGKHLRIKILKVLISPFAVLEKFCGGKKKIEKCFSGIENSFSFPLPLLWRNTETFGIFSSKKKKKIENKRRNKLFSINYFTITFPLLFGKLPSPGKQFYAGFLWRCSKTGSRSVWHNRPGVIITSFISKIFPSLFDVVAELKPIPDWLGKV